MSIFLKVRTRSKAESDVVDSSRAESSAPHDSLPHMRRGPFRPDVWVNARQRNALRLRTFYYRGLDVALTALLTLGWLTYPSAISSIGELTVAQVAPYAVGWLCAMWFIISANLYKFSASTGIWRHVVATALVSAIGLLVGLIVQTIVSTSALSHYLQWAGFTVLAIAILHLIWASVAARGRKNGALTPNVVLVGATQYAELLITEALERRDINILGIFDDRSDRSPESICGVPVLGRARDLLSHRLTPYLDCIALTLSPDAVERVGQLERQLSILPNRIAVLLQSDAPDAVEITRALDKLAYTPVHLLNSPDNDDRRAFYKRLQDLVLGSLALYALMPVLLLIGAWVRLDSRGPALFRQSRHGFNHEEIVVWKFRTMHHHRADIAGTQQVTADDDRVTRAGRFLRATSLDELPQLLNVVLGHMSLVGPRPHAIGMKTGHVVSADIVAEYAHRHRIKPGMTGWAAIKGSRGPMHNASDVRRRVQLDIDYIERQNFWFDIWIMLRTLPVLLGDKVAMR